MSYYTRKGLAFTLLILAINQSKAPLTDENNGINDDEYQRMSFTGSRVMSWNGYMTYNPITKIMLLLNLYCKEISSSLDLHPVSNEAMCYLVKHIREPKRITLKLIKKMHGYLLRETLLNLRGI